MFDAENDFSTKVFSISNTFVIFAAVILNS